MQSILGALSVTRAMLCQKHVRLFAPLMQIIVSVSTRMLIRLFAPLMQSIVRALSVPNLDIVMVWIHQESSQSGTICVITSAGTLYGVTQVPGHADV